MRLRCATLHEDVASYLFQVCYCLSKQWIHCSCVVQYTSWTHKWAREMDALVRGNITKLLLQPRADTFFTGKWERNLWRLYCSELQGGASRLVQQSVLPPTPKKWMIEIYSLVRGSTCTSRSNESISIVHFCEVVKCKLGGILMSHLVHTVLRYRILEWYKSSVCVVRRNNGDPRISRPEVGVVLV